MQHLDEGTIHSWLDGALTPEEAARVEAHVGSCSMCADATAEARGLIAASSRILTALDNVPNVRAAGGAKGAGRRSLSTWLVREKIAAVLTLVVAGGALALVMSRDTRQAAEADLAAEPMRTLELAAADSPAPPVAVEESANRESQRLPLAAAVLPPAAPQSGIAAVREPESVPAVSIGRGAPTVIADAAPRPAPPTNDSLRPVTVAQAERVEAQDASAEGRSSAAAKVGALEARRRGVEASARLTETRPTGQAFGAAAGARYGPGEAPRLVQEMTMTDSGGEVRRRIYSVDGILVTLDERPPSLLELEQRRAAPANAPRPDTAAVSTTIRWSDASGKEFTLTGAAPTERLERIRKLLGL